MTITESGPGPRAGEPVGRAPTLAQVARAAGVSPATASRVLTGSAHVSRTARERVEEAAQRLGYVPRRPTTPGRRSPGAVAVVMCDEGARVFADPFHAGLLWGVRRELGGRRPLVVLMAGTPGEWETAADYLRGGRFEGVLLIGAHPDRRACVLRAAAGAPVVLAGRPLDDVGLPYVDADNRGGAHAAVRHLLASGRRRIATIAGPADMAAGVDRLAGYRMAAQEAGMDVAGLVGHGDFGRLSGEHAMSRLLERRPGIDAVLAASDLMAVGALRALRRAGRRVPDDVAVVGFDDAPVARQVRPRLTTVRRPAEDLGARLARELRARSGGRPSGDRGVVLRTRLIIRESA
ncbi:LacI family DNA-binding transcriptional regulator [Actinomadura opuntiae]|uniref:LacI family DNA-binding transcriptional regulator n=1 Tax=Actinomadura sp. OS1-43 TaxID=604315 RepID=UPI00255AC844|nr:LacI family DNA-binding transcriptional regulator [Actinomadura sp. OS1-43]MDL4819532.1 LacI family DNA-binding transcriptional regulator [Actinomadura sp. OS1-43]